MARFVGKYNWGKHNCVYYYVSKHMRKTILNIILTITVLSCSSGDQPNETGEQFCGVYYGSVDLVSDEMIKDFAKCNYTEITGTLGIYDYSVYDPITSLSPLKSLKKIGGKLVLTSLKELTNLDGLQNLESVGSLEIFYADKLENLNALDKLQTTYIEMSKNPSLKNIDALDMDIEEMTTIAFTDLPLLESLKCFSNVKSIRNALIIENNDSLIDLTGLENVESIGLATTPADCCGTLVIDDNYNITSLKGLDNLTKIRGDFHLTTNYALTNIDALKNLTYIDGDLNIVQNTHLGDLDGLQNLTTLRGDLVIRNNLLLAWFCGLQNLFLADGLTGRYTVDHNLNNPSEYYIVNSPPCE